MCSREVLLVTGFAGEQQVVRLKRDWTGQDRFPFMDVIAIPARKAIYAPMIKSFEFQREQKNFDGDGIVGFLINLRIKFVHSFAISSSENFSISMAPAPPIQPRRVFAGSG